VLKKKEGAVKSKPPGEERGGKRDFRGNEKVKKDGLYVLTGEKNHVLKTRRVP